eukprot:Anaeramoba_ignava/c17731_g1_i1.p1 GENE.c17731_g1_i1~~c17731_g1_i1.p1  ORF type:complete len:186 (+),score=63.88 c17731_g1_i1:22-558(+)
MKKTQQNFLEAENPTELTVEIENEGEELSFQTCSDIHLEFFSEEKPYPKDMITAIAPILLLCGDIGNPDQEYLLQFLEEQSKQFKYIFYVAGNHEFYNVRNEEEKSTYQERISKLKQINSKISNVFFLERTSVKIIVHRKDNSKDYVIRLLGTTLWSSVPKKTFFKYPNDAQRLSSNL